MKYQTIVADPPWPYVKFPPSHTPSLKRWWNKPPPYSMMCVEEIAYLGAAEKFADDDCRLFLWTTNRYLSAAFFVLEHWGFEYKQTIVWRKRGRLNRIGGSIAPNHAEYLVVGVKGSPKILDRWPSTVIDAPVGAHSAKPEVFLDLIETSSPGPYLEMFARRARFGWDYWGDQSLSTADIA